MYNGLCHPVECIGTTLTRIPLPVPVASIYEAVEELQRLYPGRKFTPDGHMVGSIGEVVAAEVLGLQLFGMSELGHDALDSAGRKVQIKMTAGKSVAMYADCDRLVVLRVVSPHEADIVYDGDGAPAWAAAGNLGKNGQRVVRLSKLKTLAKSVRELGETVSQVGGLAENLGDANV